MDVDHRPRLVLDAAIGRLLRPLVRLLLRHAVPYRAFCDLAKRVYVEAALHDFALPDKKPSISRVSILTGLTRKDVQGLVNEPDDAAPETSERYNRAARVLTAWIRDPDFLHASGKPRALAGEGPRSFGALVRRHSGDMPPRAVLDELLRVGAVRRRDDGLYEPVARAYVPRRGMLDKLDILGHDVADLIDTIDHNLQAAGDDPRFQRKVMYHSIDAQALPAFRRLSAVQAQALLERLDRWLAEHDTDPDTGDAPRARVGMGIYYFEERLGPAPARRPDKDTR
jgi:Family of unknown function (DUF6502)